MLLFTCPLRHFRLHRRALHRRRPLHLPPLEPLRRQDLLLLEHQGAGVVRRGREPDRAALREGPGLRPGVRWRPPVHHHARLLAHLPRHRLLVRLPQLHEPGEDSVEARRVPRRIRQQYFLAAARRHGRDDARILAGLGWDAAGGAPAASAAVNEVGGRPAH